jgi:hypothetical protein
METLNVLLDAIQQFGEKSQLVKAVEEFTELNCAILKLLDGRPNYPNLLEEIVDAEIMLAQVKLIYYNRNPGNSDGFNYIKAEKIARLKARLERNETSN